MSWGNSRNYLNAFPSCVAFENSQVKRKRDVQVVKVVFVPLLAFVDISSVNIINSKLGIALLGC